MSKSMKTLNLKYLNRAINTALFILPLSMLPMSLAAQTADAEEEAAAAGVLEEVIVTGSHIAGLDPAVLPVTVMGAEQIDQLVVDAL